MSSITKKLHLIEHILRRSGNVHLEIPKFDGAPIWITKTFKAHLLLFGNLRIYLIEPKKSLEYDQIVSARNSLETSLSAIVLVIADDLNPKYRSAFVRAGVPYIYLDKSIFAPALGVKINNFNNRSPSNLTPKIDGDLSPFELKLLAGFLTNQLNLSNFNLNDIGQELASQDFKCSKTKLSNSITNLLSANLLNESGKGPNRFLSFKDKATVWEQVHELNIAKTHSTTTGTIEPNDFQRVLSGESALSMFSTLTEPKTPTYAISTKYKKEIMSRMHHATETQTYFYEFRKSDPLLFSVNGYLNPVEIYFDLKPNPDERVRIALDEMLAKYNLKGIYDEQT